jgi:hypothetical protein
MGIFGALTTAVTGMRAQSFALENISGNIANSQTTAFKRMDTSFVDLIPDETPSKQLSGSVVANARMTNTVQGDVQSSTIGTYMAINGDGGRSRDRQPRRQRAAVVTVPERLPARASDHADRVSRQPGRIPDDAERR